jgi:hypothetical protein
MSESDRGPREYRYRHIEKALATVFNVTEPQLGAFRARLRHLRNLGVPRTDKVGSGNSISYSRDNALELLFTLEMEALNVPPRTAAGGYIGVVEGFLEAGPQYLGQDLYLVIVHGKDPFGKDPFGQQTGGFTTIVSLNVMSKLLNEHEKLSLVNLSRSVAAFDLALAAA